MHNGFREFDEEFMKVPGSLKLRFDFRAFGSLGFHSGQLSRRGLLRKGNDHLIFVAAR